MSSRLSSLLVELAPEEGKELLSSCGAVAVQMIVVAIVEMLPEDRIDGFFRFVEQGDADAFETYLRDSVPTIDEFLEGEIERLREELAELTAV